MLLQTNSYIVPKDKRSEHSRLIRRFRQTLGRLGCDHFEVYEQVGANWSAGETTGRYVQIMRFRDRKHQLSVQSAERSDPGAQALIAEFCELINFPYQQQQGLFAVGFYQSSLPNASMRHHANEADENTETSPTVRADAGKNGDPLAAKEDADVVEAEVVEAPMETVEEPHDESPADEESPVAEGGNE